MSASFLKFSSRLLLVLGIAFGIHVLILKTFEFPLFENKIVLAYSVNAVMAIAIYGFLIKMKEKHKEQIGFMFIGGSLLKFAIFFVLFYGTYKADGNISKLEFAAFFTPYVIALFMETFSLAKWLNKLD